MVHFRVSSLSTLLLVAFHVRRRLLDLVGQKLMLVVMCYRLSDLFNVDPGNMWHLLMPIGQVETGRYYL